MTLGRATDSAELAITGFACRLPGARDPEAFWRLLIEERSAISAIGPDRWNTGRFHHPERRTPGRAYTFAAGQVGNLWDFDPGFFGISPREAAQMDPQQRMLLEVAHEAVEAAALAGARLSSDRTGVFVGASSMDHSQRFAADVGAIGQQFMTGNTLSILSNRISYALDLKGPSYTVDTACSSSFFALDQAAQALASGRIDTAIVGGVNAILQPYSFVGFSHAAMLSPSGLCRAFDAAADGYVRAEGAVVFVLRRLADARGAGDPVRAVLLGTGVNADGRTVGLSMPSAEHQARLLSDIYGRLGLAPDMLAFVEAHGTGTPVGDPIEAHAIGEVLGRGRARALPIGSVKSNVGHLEPASGLVGLLKAVLALEHGVFPRSLHVEEINPHVRADELGLAVATEAAPIPPRVDGRAWIAGVNSFGFGGANAHAVLREALPSERPAPPPASTGLPGPLVLSAASEASLKRLAAAWAERLREASGAEAAALLATAAHRRARHGHRAIVAAGEPAAMAAALDRLAAGQAAEGLATGRAPGKAGRTAFVFAGNGSQWPGMGRALHEGDTAFRDAFERFAAAFAALAVPGEPAADLVRLLHDPATPDRLEESEVAQPLIFAIQAALVEALAARGIAPEAVAGHSVGEVAAAWAAGALTLEAAARLIHVRSRAVGRLAGRGGMAAVLAPAADVEAAIASLGLDGRLSLAGDNSPRSATIAGEGEALDIFAREARGRRMAVRRLKVAYPYHGPAMEEIREELAAGLAGLSPGPERVDLVSSTTGGKIGGEALDAAYWWRNARQPVLFRQALRALSELGCTIFVEIGPRPVLQSYVTDTLRDLGRPGAVLPTMDGPDRACDIGGIAGRIVAHGGSIDDARFFGAEAPARHDLPAYPWDHAPYRCERTGESVDVFGERADHPLLGWRLRHGEGSWRGYADTRLLPWLGGHVVEGAAVMPAAGFAEIALAAGEESLGTRTLELSDFDIIAPLALDGPLQAIRTELERETGILRIESRAAFSEDDWRLHARGTIRRAAAPPLYDAAAQDRDAPVSASVWTGERLYRLLAEAGLAYGPDFRLVENLRAAGAGASADLAEPPSAAQPSEARFVLHPATLDSAFHAIFPLLLNALRDVSTRERDSFLPVRIGRLVTAGGPAAPRVATARLARMSAFGAEAEILLRDADGAVVARVEGLRLKRVRLARRREGPVAWGEILVPLAAPEEPAALPDAWSSDAAGRLAALGLIGGDGAPSHEPDAGALLVDAAARRIAWDALDALAGPGRRIARAGGTGVDPSARPLHARLVAALEEDGALAPAGEAAEAMSLAADCPYPPLAEAIEALIAEAPARTGALAQLTEIAGGLSTRLAGGLEQGSPARIEAEHSPGRRAVWESVEAFACDLADRWDAGRRLAILILGEPPAGLVTRLAERAGVTRITLSDADARVSDRLRLTIRPHHAVAIAAWEALGGPFDVVLAGDALWRAGSDGMARLSTLMAPGALLAAVEPEAGLADDLIGGQHEGWWRDSLAPDMPVGRRLDAAETLRDLARAGLVAPKAWPLQRAEIAATVAVTRRRATAAAALRETGPEDETGADEAEAPAVVVLHDGSDECAKEATALAASLGASLGAQGARAEARDAAAAGSLAGAVIVLMPGRDPGAAPGADPRIELCRKILTGGGQPEALWLVTRGGRPADRDGIAPALPRRPREAAFWALGRVLSNEHPGIAIRQVDLDPALDAAEARGRLAALIAAPGEEREIVLDRLGLAAPRTVALLDPAPTAARLRAGTEAGTRLALGREGSIDTLHWAPALRRAPEAGEVEIAVEATGLNFRDLMWAQRLLPPEALEDGFAGATLGMECAGRVVRAGGDAGVEPGTRVLAFAPAAFASHVTVSAEVVAPLPDTLSSEAAAGLPAVFLTAQYALGELAQLREGETVLIHGAAGGVGLAAIQIARLRGARVMATAGRGGKRLLVRLLGAEAVFDSRGLGFADEVRAATGGRGVDVVLNSLAGEAMARSLDCLGPFGRFVELGKQDYFANSRLGLRPFRRNLSYFGVDADQLIGARPEIARRVFAELMQGFASGALIPSPVQVFEPEEAVDAFRLMQRSDHVGKIVIRPSRPEAPRDAATEAPSGGTWLIVGGLGGFGLATARWLARRGARRIWLTSRSGLPQTGGEAVLAEIAALGCRVEAVAVDASDREASEMLIARIRAEGRPLEGVVHAAMVLDDAPFAELTPERVAQVMRPKIEGAELLDRLTRPLAPRHFLLYSSISVAFGNPGQAAYVAANAALEAIAANRRAEGLPGLAIGWGPISDQGYLSRAEETRAFIERRLDGALLTAEEALDGLGALLADPAAGPVVRYAPMRWSSLAGDLALVSTPLFERVDREKRGGSASGRDFLAEIAELDDATARARIVEALVAETARILRQPEASLDPHRPLASLGFDSLMAVDLKMSAEEELGISLPLMSLGDQMTIADLAGRVLDQIRSGAGAAAEHAEGAEAAIERLRAQHGDAEAPEAAIEALIDRARRTGGLS